MIFLVIFLEFAWSTLFFSPMSALSSCPEFQPTPDQIGALQGKFNLSYHIPYAAQAAKEVGLAGKRVIEVGGSLPVEFVKEHLGVKQWTAVEELDYYRNTIGPQRNCAPLDYTFTKPLSDAIPKDLENNEYLLLDGAVENSPTGLDGQFDVVFSIACFEHLSRMPLALLAMFRLLKPGGMVFSMFSPIWSSHDGHHIPTIIDSAGQKFVFNKNSPISPWEHLLCTPSQLYQRLLRKTDSTAAEEIVYYTYHSPRLNRLFSEDYLRYFAISPFKVCKVVPTFNFNPPKELQAELERYHPGNKYFANNGFLTVLQRPL